MTTFKWTVCVAAGAMVGAVAYVVLVPSPDGILPAEPEAAHRTTAPVHETTRVPSQGERSADDPRTLADIRRLPSDFERAAALYDLLRQVGVPTLEDLLREASESQAGEATKSIIYARFADLHPDAAVTHIVATREDKRFLTTSSPPGPTRTWPNPTANQPADRNSQSCLIPFSTSPSAAPIRRPFRSRDCSGPRARPSPASTQNSPTTRASSAIGVCVPPWRGASPNATATSRLPCSPCPTTTRSSTCVHIHGEHVA